MTVTTKPHRHTGSRTSTHPSIAGREGRTAGTHATVGRRQDRSDRHAGGRVLCVEDNQAIGDLMRVFLEPAGYEVMVAGDGETAWTLINSTSIDVLVTDHDIPRLSGCDLVERMRAAGYDLPIVIVFGSLEALARDEIEQHGIANWLLKPYSQPQLLAAVEAALATASHPAQGLSHKFTHGRQAARSGH